MHDHPRWPSNAVHLIARAEAAFRRRRRWCVTDSVIACIAALAALALHRTSLALLFAAASVTALLGICWASTRRGTVYRKQSWHYVDLVLKTQLHRIGQEGIDFDDLRRMWPTPPSDDHRDDQDPIPNVG